MSYIEFEKEQLVNLEYSLSREVIRSNRAGSYASTTIICCNTRKYHGLLVCPMEDLDGGNHVLLSALDETVIQRGKEFNLAIHKYPGTYNPKGHKYVRDFETEPIPALIYRVGGVLLKKEMLLEQDEERILIKYTLLEASSPTTIKFKPFLAFRNVHALSKANMDADFRYKVVENGIKVKLYNGYKNLFIQFSKKNEYVPVPHWYYNLEYIEEQDRGYDAHEDLYVPGYFEMSIKKGESIVFSAGLKEVASKALKSRFESQVKARIPRDSFRNCLINSAQQFIVRRGSKTEIIAGFPWFGRWGRDTFIALPGLTLSIDNVKDCIAVLDTMAKELKNGLFPNIGSGETASYNSADAPLWFIWAVQKLAGYTKDYEMVWKRYGKKVKSILEAYKSGTDFNIRMREDGLIYASTTGVALTWMDAIVHGKPVTPRMGCPVELSALWYNAVCFGIEMASIAGDNKFVFSWFEIKKRIEQSFVSEFWSETKGYLADYVNGDFKDWSVRPNMIFAASMEYSPVPDQIKKAIVDKVQKELLTPKGLRTLSPKNPMYKGKYAGNQISRDQAYHQGTVWPWLTGHFAEAYLKLHGKSGVAFIKSLFLGFEDDMTSHGVGAISEVYDGDPPHKAGGAISQAWSVAEILRIRCLLDQYENIKGNEPITKIKCL